LNLILWNPLISHAFFYILVSLFLFFSKELDLLANPIRPWIVSRQTGLIHGHLSYLRWDVSISLSQRQKRKDSKKAWF